MKISSPIFEKAYLKDLYSKAEFISILNELVAPNTLNESDEIIVGSVLFSLNDAATKQLTLIKLIEKIELNKNSASKYLIEKILLNQEIKTEYDQYKLNKKKEDRKWLLGLGAFILVVSGGLAYKFDYLKLPIPTATEGAKVVVLDTAKLALSATVPYMGKQLSPQQAEQVSIQYRDNLQREIAKYVDNGYIIINRSSVYVTDQKNDITDKVIRAVGLEPINQEQFDSSYSSQEKYNVLKSFSQNNVGDYQQQFVQEQDTKFNQEAEQNLNSQQLIVGDQGQSIDLE
ncbi:hypothetical protein HLH17_16390 [Acinetobacter sp. ANC 5380]|uniref:Uncharacterized protein n=1 Tax=Acinetobacter terrae TaxID=2731247 RepID=A0A7Y2RIC3_9GAMM|nr:hypothetical protein [Acinetobacter terrae]NNH79197.1 hypothetical protein [Acinetobacter terrae]